jgi:hypothetical protein
MSESPADADNLQTLFAEAVLHGVRLAFLDKQRASDAAARLSPSYVLHGPRGSIHLTYLVREHQGHRLRALVKELQGHDDDDAYAEFEVLAPDAEYCLHDDDATDLRDTDPSEGDVFDVYTADEIEAALLGADVPAHWNVIGAFPPGILNHALAASKMLDQYRKKADNVFADVRGLYNHIADHKESDKKEGSGIVGAVLDKDVETGKPRRKIRNVLTVGYIGLDFDGGQTEEEVADKLQALGITFATYSSYRHLMDGKTHKFRVVVPLSPAFDTSQFESRETANAVWKSSYETFCEAQGFNYDQAAKDITRFFNSPRHPKGGEFFSRIYGGKLFELPIVMPDDRPVAKIAKKRGVKLAYDATGEPYVAEGSGVEFFETLIGDGPDQLGFHNPIFRVVCAYYSKEGPDADAGPIIQRLRQVIQKAEKGPGRPQSDIDRYMSAEYLGAEAESAQKFIRERVEAKEAEETADKEHMDALVADYRKTPDPKKLEEICEELVEIGRDSLTFYCRDALASKVKGETSVTRGAFDAVMKPFKGKAEEQKAEGKKRGLLGLMTACPMT